MAKETEKSEEQAQDQSQDEQMNTGGQEGQQEVNADAANSKLTVETSNEAIHVLMQAADAGMQNGIYAWEDLMKIYSARQFILNAMNEAQEQQNGPS